MLAQEIIKRKRDGLELLESEISWFINEMTNGRISEGQIAAFAMSVYFRGMTTRERICLTETMITSGKKLDWDFSGPIMDKHSTGGVGDCVSLLLAPALAACGGYVPMISGRGLGHTGGTLDKFDAIPGYNTSPNLSEIKKIVRDIGCVIVGQTTEIAPADKELYSVRDVTATIDSVDLITASILSKKLSASLDCLVLDIKFGNGAFMTSRSEAMKLGHSLLAVGNGLNCKTSAILSDMNQPLCSSIGNSLEVSKVVEILTGNSEESRLMEVVCNLGGKLLTSTGLTSSTEKGIRKIERSFSGGYAAEIFEKMVHSLGGPKSFLQDAKNQLPTSKYSEDIYIDCEGYISEIDTRAIGLCLIELGGGRKRTNDIVDYSVGFEKVLQISDYVDKKTPLVRVHFNSLEALKRVKPNIQKAFKISFEKPDRQTMIHSCSL